MAVARAAFSSTPERRQADHAPRNELRAKKPVGTAALLDAVREAIGEPA
jgi:hypothetical protein